MSNNKYKESQELAKYIDDFLKEYAPNHLTDSENTLRAYETTLTLYLGYLDYCGVDPVEFSKKCFDQKHVEGWIAWMASERSCCEKSCNARLGLYRTFAEYLSTRDIKYLSVGIDAKLVTTKTPPKKKVSGLSKGAVQAILDAPDPRTRNGLRDETLMITLYGTAARIDELLSLKVKELKLTVAKPNVVIQGKRGVTRTLYLLPRAVEYLRLYIKKYHDNNFDSEDYLFYSPIHGKGKKLSQQAVRDLLRKHAEIAHQKCADVPLNLHAHQFRHAKATHWLEDGMNIVQISLLLGHASVETTMIYLDITTEQEHQALSTLQTEEQKKIKPKWDSKGSSLAELCGMRRLKSRG